MRVKTVFVFLTAVALSSVLAVVRFGDSGHAAGMLSSKGGKVRHAVHLEPGKGRYVLAVTGTVQPPYRGNAQVDIQGEPEMDCEIFSPRPALDLGLRRKPVLRNNLLEDLQPKDRFSLWVVMRPRNADWEGQRGSHALKNTVTLRDTETGDPLMQIPVVYGSKKEASRVEAE